MSHISLRKVLRASDKNLNLETLSHEMGCFSWDGTDSLSRNFGKKLSFDTA